MEQRRPKVLYIDDDPALVRLVQKVLGRRGYDVEHAVDSETGLARLQDGGIDAVALDHYLPTGTGIDLLERLESHGNAVPVVYVTGSLEAAIAVSALKAGAADYVIKTAGGEFMELLHSALDQALEKARLLADKARAEQQVREARDRAEALLHEVNHRVANSLALVASLVGMQKMAVSDTAAIDALAETQARISAIAGIHRRLYSTTDVHAIAMDDYLKNLVEDLDVTMKSAGHDAFVKLDVAPVSLSTDKAVSMGVIVTELVTNAYKYAYVDRPKGEVRVALRHDGDDTILLSVEDDGIGWTGEGEPKGTGVGGRIVNAMARTLGGRIQYASQGGGTRAWLDFKPEA